MPDYVMDRRKIQMQLDIKNKRRSKSAHHREFRPQQVPDDVGYLETLVEKGILVKTPPQDYDDSYCIAYAKAKDGFIVTNDMFRDHFKQKNLAEDEIKQMKKRLISFTFHQDEFLPCPDAHFFNSN